MTPEEIQTYASIIDGLGTLAVLLIAVVSFARGNVVPRSMLEKIESIYQEQLDELQQELDRNTETEI